MIVQQFTETTVTIYVKFGVTLVAVINMAVQSIYPQYVQTVATLSHKKTNSRGVYKVICPSTDAIYATTIY